MEQFENMNDNPWYIPEEQISKAKYEYEKHHREFTNKLKKTVY